MAWKLHFSCEAYIPMLMHFPAPAGTLKPRLVRAYETDSITTDMPRGQADRIV